MTDLTQFLSGDHSSDTLAGASRTAAEMITAEQAAIDHLAGERDEALPRADHARLDEIEDEIKMRKRNIEIVGAQRQEIDRRRLAAEAAEKMAGLEKLRDETAALQAEGVKLLEVEYFNHAYAIRQILERIVAIDAAISRANNRLEPIKVRFATPEQTLRAKVPDGQSLNHDLLQHAIKLPVPDGRGHFWSKP